MKETSLLMIDELIEKYPNLLQCQQDILLTLELLVHSYKNGGKLLVCGNGGSAADSQHIVGELVKSFALPRKLGQTKKERILAMFPEEGEFLSKNLQEGLPSISLMSESSLISAYANDQSWELVFAQQVYILGNKDDVFLAISTSGNSKNVLYACKVARLKGLKIIGLTGNTGGQMRDLCDAMICVPAQKTHQIQEYHLPIYHSICLALENEFFG